MSRPVFIPSFDRAAALEKSDGHHYAQAVRIGNRVETSGQGGWNEDRAFPAVLSDEIAQAFDNLTIVLAQAESCWDDVISVDSWHLPLDEATYALMVNEFRVRMPNHRPIWTAVSVPSFGLPGMRVEIRVTAMIPQPGISSPNDR